MMNKDSTYAFYGSLRRGMSNYEVYKNHLRYLYSTRLRGFQLFSLGPYPFARETNNPGDSILVEVFKITDRTTEQQIHQLEVDAAYFYKDTRIVRSEVGIYLFSTDKNYPRVLGGDWVDFFRKSNNS